MWNLLVSVLGSFSWSAFWSFYLDAGTLYFVIATVFVSFGFVMNFTDTFKYYVENGAFDRFDIENANCRHPGRNMCIYGLRLLYVIPQALLWPVSVLYIVFTGAAIYVRKKTQEKSQFLTNLFGKEKTW